MVKFFLIQYFILFVSGVIGTVIVSCFGSQSNN